MLKNKIGWKKANLYNQQYIMKRIIEATSIHTKENLLLNDLSNSQSYNIIWEESIEISSAQLGFFVVV